MERDTVLVVDDEPGICEVIQTFFACFGWRVITTDGLEQASAVLRTEIARVVVVISDDHMGGYGLNGTDLYFQRQVDLEIHSIPFILMSGTSRLGFMESARSFGMHPINKPFVLRELSELLRSLGVIRSSSVPRGEL